MTTQRKALTGEALIYDVLFVERWLWRQIDGRLEVEFETEKWTATALQKNPV